jgi:mycothiol synthase
VSESAQPGLTIERVESESGLDDLLAVRNAVDQQAISRATHAARSAEDVDRLRLIACEDRVLAGAGEVAWTPWTQPIGEAIFRVWVLPERRAQGIGTRLFAALLAFARDHGMTKGFGRVLAQDAPSLAFARKRGFEVFGMHQVGLLELDDAATDDGGDTPDGIVLASMAERRDLLPAVYDLESVTIREVPSMADLPVPSFETWRAAFDQPKYLWDLSVIAVAGGEVVGSIELEDDGDGTAFIALASVAPHMRRRGIARAMKREVARRARAAGWRRLETLNDGGNDKIRRLNEELGYRYLPEVLLVEGSLGPT